MQGSARQEVRMDRRAWVWMWAVAGVCLTLWSSGAAAEMPRWQRELQLKDHLLRNYDRSALPPPEHVPTTVRIRVKLLHITMDEKNEVVHADAWLVNAWDDPRLAWYPARHNNITSIDFPDKVIWKPDLAIYNSAHGGADHDFGDRLVSVTHTGHVKFVVSVQLQYTCVVDLTYWPHDSHNCTLMFGSWHHSGASIDLQVMDDRPQMDLMMRVSTHDSSFLQSLLKKQMDQMIQENENVRTLTRGWWKLEDAILQRWEDRYDCCTEPYVSIRMSLLLTRDAPAFKWTVKMPAVALCILTFIMFLLPPCAGEKLIFGGICLILDVMFIAYTSVTVAHAPSHTPLIVELVCQQLLLTVASVVVAAVSTRLARDPHARPLPDCFMKPLHLFSACLCLNSYRSLVMPTPWKPVRTTYTTSSIKTDEVELSENGRSQLYTGTGSCSSNHTSRPPSHAAPPQPPAPSYSTPAYTGLDYLLLAALLDRVCLLIFILIFVINMISYKAVL